VRELVDDLLLVRRLSRLALHHFLQLARSLSRRLRIQWVDGGITVHG
jgi:hypothetical protein